MCKWVSNQTQKVQRATFAACLSLQVCQFVVSVNGLNVLHVDYRTVSNLILTGPRTIVMEVMEEIESWKEGISYWTFLWENSQSQGSVTHRGTTFCVQVDYFAFGEGGSLSFNSNSTGYYAKWAIDTSIFSLRTSLCLSKTKERPLGCLSSQVCIRQNGFHLRGRADFLTVHHWIKHFRRWKSHIHCEPGCHRCCVGHTDVGKHPLVVESWVTAGFIATEHKGAVNASLWNKCIRVL